MALRDLLAAAGGPTLTATAAAANAAGRDRVSVQKLSNWCSGRHLPDQFDTIAPVLLWLTVRARDNGKTAPGSRSPVALRTIRDWYRQFIAARHSSTTAAPLDLQARIDAAEYLLAHPDPDTALTIAATAGTAQDGASAGEELTTAILQLTGIDPATNAAVATDVPTSALPADAADLLSAAGLTTTESATSEPSSNGLMRWVDPKLPVLWGRAAPLIEQYRPALAARTALLADAARWKAAPNPQSLYTWQQLTVCGRHLHTLPIGAIAAPEQAQPYRFGGGATAQHIPSPALPFWNASHAAAQRQLTAHRLIMATVIGLIVIAVIAGGIAGMLTS
ncbi:hypothetical protein [Tsukamurella sputi]|uniref:hypothetical protein n=1 Tax=Tsukamurella sputi TaxID=2591848 RepID=UPI0011B7DCC1|nr:hypothetical protein [Tsukamurella sputi]